MQQIKWTKDKVFSTWNGELTDHIHFSINSPLPGTKEYLLQVPGVLNPEEGKLLNLKGNSLEECQSVAEEYVKNLPEDRPVYGRVIQKKPPKKKSNWR